jgi:hypothetical protein
VLGSDRFGNVITTVTDTDLSRLAGRPGDQLEVVLGGSVLPLVSTYSDVPPGEACALVGSSGRLEVAVNRGRGDGLPGSHPGAPVLVRRRR